MFSLHALDAINALRDFVQPNRARDRERDLAALRPLIRDKGVLWGRACLARFNVQSFRALKPRDRATLYAELTAG